jgi:hypothetical protein
MIMGFTSGSEKELGMHQIEACIVEHGSVQEAVASAPIAQEARPRVLCSEWCHACGRQFPQDAVRVSQAFDCAKAVKRVHARQREQVRFGFAD